MSTNKWHTVTNWYFEKVGWLPYLCSVKKYLQAKSCLATVLTDSSATCSPACCLALPVCWTFYSHVPKWGAKVEHSHERDPLPFLDRFRLILSNERKRLPRIFTCRDAASGQRISVLRISSFLGTVMSDQSPDFGRNSEENVEEKARKSSDDGVMAYE